MKTLIVLRRFLHQLPTEVKKALTKITKAVLHKDNFSLLPQAIFFQQKAQPVAKDRERSTAAGEMAEF